MVEITTKNKELLTILAKAHIDGEDVLDELHDLFCECGYSLIARIHFDRKRTDMVCPPGSSCHITFLINWQKWDEIEKIGTREIEG